MELPTHTSTPTPPLAPPKEGNKGRIAVLVRVLLLAKTPSMVRMLSLRPEHDSGYPVISW